MTLQPLTNRRILITRPRRQAGGLCAKLSALGAVPILFPTIEIASLDDYSELDEAIRRLDHYDWIIFTSVNGVAAFWKRLDLSGFKNLTGLTTRIAAIGPATAQALIERGATPSFIPAEYVAEAIVAGLGNVDGQRILIPCAEIAREVLTVELRRRGAVVHEIAAYRTQPAAPDPTGLAELKRGVDAITFTSSSTVRNFISLVGQDSAFVGNGERLLPHQPAIACIGPITAQAAREAGLPVSIVAAADDADYTTDGLITALVNYYSQLP